MRKLEKIGVSRLYSTEYDIDDKIEQSRGSLILEEGVTDSILSQVLNGQMIIDKANNRIAIKETDSVLKLVVDENSEVKFEKIT